jgi:hypothetical protein
MADYDEATKTAATSEAAETCKAKEATATAEAAKATAISISTPTKTARVATESERRTTCGNDYLDQGPLAMARRPVDMGAGTLEPIDEYPRWSIHTWGRPTRVRTRQFDKVDAIKRK